MRRRLVRDGRSSALVFVALALAWCARAVAQEEPEALIRQGVEMRKGGDDVKAHGYFQRAYEIAHTPRAAAQLGLADLAIDDNLSAEQHLSEALASGDPWIRQYRAVLEKSRADARAQLGKLLVNRAPASTQVEIGGRPPVRLPLDATLWVPAGGVELRFSAPNCSPLTKQVTIAAGATTVLEIELPAIPAATTGAVAPSDGKSVDRSPPAHSPELVSVDAPTRSWRATAGWVAGGVGFALLVGGVAAEVLHASKVNEFNNVTNAPNPGGHCDTALPNVGGGSCQSILDAANTRSTFAIIGFVAGGIALASSVALYLTAPRPGAHHDFAVACVPSRETTGLLCGLTQTF
jgi:hypothetical protein